MPRVEKELVCDDRSVVRTFAGELRRVRLGRPYRLLASRSYYAHTSLVRAASGENLPTWEVTEAFLGACNTPPDEIPDWYRLWTVVSALSRSEQEGQCAEFLACLEQVRSHAASHGASA